MELEDVRLGDGVREGKRARSEEKGQLELCSSLRGNELTRRGRQHRVRDECSKKARMGWTERDGFVAVRQRRTGETTLPRARGETTRGEGEGQKRDV